MFRALVVMLAAAAPAFADDSKLKVKVGDAFPDVPVAATQIEKVKKDAKAVSVADLKGKVVVVFFYPKALTKGCTIESCGFRDLAKDFPADVVVLGASGDDVALNQKFTDEHKLPYPLLCDTELTLIKALGIQSAKGKTAQRVSFLVDRGGKIAKIYEGVKVGDHPKEVLKDATELAEKK